MKNRTITQFLMVPALVFGATFAQGQGMINTIAGTGIPGYSGDGGPAISAQFSNPAGVAVNSSGDVFIADKSNSRVRMISGSTGIMSTFAGTGVYGLSGLGGPARRMAMRMPDAVSVAPNGDVLITDWYNDLVFRVDHVTLNGDNEGGDGNQGNNDNCLAKLGRLKIPAGACMDNFGRTYIADNGNNRVRIIVPTPSAAGTVNMIHTLANTTGAYGYTGDGGLAVDAHFNHIGGVVYDPMSNGDLYVSDAGNNVIRKINLESGIITTVVGTGVAGYSGDGGSARSAKLYNPGNLFIDGAHNLYICDRSNNVIRKVELLSGLITTVAGNGTMGFSGDGGYSTMAQLNDPEGVWVDNAGNMFIADMGNQRVRKIDAPVVTPSSTFAGTGVLYSAGGSTPGIAPGSVYSGGTSEIRTRHLSPKGSAAVNTTSTEVVVFPNPSTGVFNVQTGASFENAVIEVYNVLGEKVFSGNADGQNGSFSLAGQPSGIYTLALKGTSGKFIQKITLAN